MEKETQKTAPAPLADKKKKNDLIFIVLLLVVAMTVGGCLLLFRTEGDRVVVLVAGEVYGEYALSQNQTVEIVTEKGRNLLVIENGRAYVSDASCPDGICAKHRPVSFVGQSILCKPHQVAIEIRGKDKNQPDIII